MEISQIGKTRDRQRFFSRWRKSGELWSSNNTVLHADSDPPKSTFSEARISAPTPRGHCQIKFLHALENSQGLLTHTYGGGGPGRIFNNKHSKIGLKFSVLAVVTLETGV